MYSIKMKTEKAYSRFEDEMTLNSIDVGLMLGKEEAKKFVGDGPLFLSSSFCSPA